jgi:pimeloyl-ACP methyl ester carboxylesterase
VSHLRAATRLAIEATTAVTEIVEAMHREIGGPPALLSAPIYGAIRGVTGLVGAGLDAALARLEPLLGAGAPGGEALVAALNGVLGDHLDATGSALAIRMRLRVEGVPGRKVVVLVHGSSMGDRQWRRRGHDHGEALARDLGYTPVYVQYNSGLHVSRNGRALAALLEELPADELAIVAHSMGGLVARSACHHGAGLAWRARLRHLVCLGTPHHGATLERAGNWVGLALGVSRYSAPLGRLARLRSAGVTDLRHGNVLDEHWQGRDRFAHAPDGRAPLPLPDGVRCYAIAGARDGMVAVPSALGVHPRPELTLRFDETWVGAGVGHLDLLDHPEVYEKLRGWLG